MEKELVDLLVKINDRRLASADIIKWGSPIVSFGNPKYSIIATIGLNPSNREFIDAYGNELDGPIRRFHTLHSLKLGQWEQATKRHHHLILDLCFNYFRRNPYDYWFKKLDYLISGTRASYYFPSRQACHLDLIPYATFSKWTALSLNTKNALLFASGDLLGILLKRCNVSHIILNGKTVVDNLQKLANVEFHKYLMKDWVLPRKNSEGVAGYAYKATITKIGNVRLNRAINVLGYNHNIQSSFGVTKQVNTAIRDWISKSISN